MKHLTNEYGIKLFNKFKKKALEYVGCGDIESAIRFIKSAAWVSYEFYLTYKDDELEELLQRISKHIENTQTYIKREKTIAFIDVFSKDTQGLSTQYIDAIIESKYNLIYLYEKEFDNDSLLYHKLSNYPKCTLIKVPQAKSSLKTSQWIYDTIIEYGIDKILTQLLPDSAAECIAIYALPRTIKRFQINLTDHAFWLGSGCFDYTLEFRQQGCSISTLYRGFNEDQVLLLPFYPVQNNVPFMGFPPLVKDKVIIFSGGASYKVIDEDDTFFQLCKGILDGNENAVILFATNDISDAIKKRINQLNINERFVLLPFRKDIAACFQNIDIYLNTYPTGGGLMCQYAAQNSVPILNYLNTNIEGCINQKGCVSFTKKSKKDFWDEAIKLCSDKRYRFKKGIELHQVIISEQEFIENFKIAISKLKTPIPVVINSNTASTYSKEAKIQSLNNTNEFRINLIRKLGFRFSLLFIPLILLKELPHFIMNNFILSNSYLNYKR